MTRARESGALEAGRGGPRPVGADRDRQPAGRAPQHAQDALLPAMAAVRAAANELEGVVADDLWPLPTHQEMLLVL
jgi:glutamine synthetase